jgi:hypothetical protein
MIAVPKKTLTGLLFLLTLSGCNPFMFCRPDSERLVTSGWAKQPMEQKEPEAIYCYKTLGERVCYTSPKSTEYKRLSGYYGPKP